MRAYSLNRPVGMGTYPKPENGDWEITNFGEYRFVEEIGKRAWGYVDYENDMPTCELERFEMVTAEMCAKPELPPENVMRMMFDLYKAEQWERFMKHVDKVERKGYDMEAVDDRLGEMLMGVA